MTPLLRPGLHVLRRTDGRLQVGLDHSRAAFLPDTPATRTELRRLERGELLDPAQVPEPLLPLLRRPDERPRGRVAVVRFGHPSGETFVGRIATLLADAGLASARTKADVALIAGVGEPNRALVDSWAQRGVPHMLLRLSEGEAKLGPFVQPGATACLRCVDAFQTDEDPSWPLLVEQYVAASARDRADGLGEPCDPMLAEVAGAWAARDVVSFLLGKRPSTWSTSIRLDPLLREIGSSPWLRHPDCGCAWPQS